MSIEVKNVTKFYGKQKALDNVSFTIKKGEITGFLGPNGAGKSTMMKIITGFISKTSGQVLVNGLDIDENELQVQKIIGYLPENNPLNLEMYVREYLSFVTRIYKVKNKKHKVDEIIELVGLTPEQNKKIGELSKGYRQRVGLAQALIHDPEILILDEPTSGLDPNQIIEIRELIKKVGKDKTVMLSTHIMQEVEAICNNVIIINKDKIIANNSVKDIQDIISDEIIKIEVEFDKKITEKQLSSIPGILEIIKLDETKWLLTSSKNTDLRPKIFNFAISNELTVLSLHKKEKSLEEIFQLLTSKTY